MDTQDESARLMEAALADPENINAVNLTLQLMQASHRQYAATTTALIEGYQNEIAQLRAERQLIRETITELCSGPHVPNPNWVMDAVFVPNRRRIKEILDHEDNHTEK